MDHYDANALLYVVIINTAVLAIFLLSFGRPANGRDWRAVGTLFAFVIALFTEMYGFPLTIYLLSGFFASRSPGIDPFAYSAGQLWHTVFGIERTPVYVLSHILVGGGFILVAIAWRVLYNAQRNHQLAQAGPYLYIRHPQYAGFILIMLGMLLTWPALSTFAMFPILVVVYLRLARREERETAEQFGIEYRRYMASTPAFFPRFWRT